MFISLFRWKVQTAPGLWKDFGRSECEQLELAKNQGFPTVKITYEGSNAEVNLKEMTLSILKNVLTIFTSSVQLKVFREDKTQSYIADFLKYQERVTGGNIILLFSILSSIFCFLFQFSIFCLLFLFIFLMLLGAGKKTRLTNFTGKTSFTR